MGSITLLAHAEFSEEEACEDGFSMLQGIIAGVYDPSLMGLPSLVPAAGGAMAPFHQPTGSVTELSGTFNGGAAAQSVLMPVPSFATYQPQEGYQAVWHAQSGVAVPPRHALTILQGHVGTTFNMELLSLYSGNFPYGALAPAGSISFQDVRAVWLPRGDEGDQCGLPVMLSAKLAISVGNYLNGRAICQSAFISVGIGGVLTSGPTPAPLPQDFDAAVARVRPNLSKVQTDLSSAINALGDCLHMNFPTTYEITATCSLGTPQSQVNPGASDVSTIGGLGSGTDVSPGNFIVGSSFVLGAGRSVSIPCSMSVARDVVVPRGAVLYVKGALNVVGHLYMDRLSTLVVQGDLTLGDTLDVTETPDNNAPINTTVIVAGHVNLEQGMSHSGSIDIAPAPPLVTPACPFPPSTLTCLVPGNSPPTITHEVANPNCQLFTTQSASCLARLPPDLAQYFGVVTASDVTSDFVPGALIYCDQDIIVGSSAKMSGLLVAQGDINLSCQRFVGAAWSRTGNIFAPSTVFRYYPYYTHAFIQSPDTSLAADGVYQLVATCWHRTAFGRTHF